MGRTTRLTKEEVTACICDIGIIPALRVSSAEDAEFAAEAVTAGGIPIVEVTMTVPGALEVIASLARKGSDLIVGAGTVLDSDTARRCLGAGAMFLTSTGLDSISWTWPHRKVLSQYREPLHPLRSSRRGRQVQTS